MNTTPRLGFACDGPLVLQRPLGTTRLGSYCWFVGSIVPTRAPRPTLNATPIPTDRVLGDGGQHDADALDTPLIAEGQAIGTGVAYLRTVDGEVLTFSPDGESFVDAQTGTKWNILGHAVEGPLAGARLEPVIHRNEFWFAWAAFNTGSPVYGTS